MRRATRSTLFTTHDAAVREAHEFRTDGSQTVSFHAVLGKPFEVDERVDAVAHAVRTSVPFSLSPNYLGSMRPLLRIDANDELDGLSKQSRRTPANESSEPETRTIARQRSSESRSQQVTGF